jgi:hypothetical protein
MPRPTIGALLHKVIRLVRKTARDELRARGDNNSFPAVSPWLAQAETQASRNPLRGAMMRSRSIELDALRGAGVST